MRPGRRNGPAGSIACVALRGGLSTKLLFFPARPTQPNPSRICAPSKTRAFLIRRSHSMWSLRLFDELLPHQRERIVGKAFPSYPTVPRDGKPQSCSIWATRDNSRQYGAIVVPEPHAKHRNQPHQATIRSLQNHRFCGKFSLLVRPVMVPRITLNQRVRGSSPRRRTSSKSEIHLPRRRFQILAIHGGALSSSNF